MAVLYGFSIFHRGDRSWRLPAWHAAFRKCDATHAWFIQRFTAALG